MVGGSACTGITVDTSDQNQATDRTPLLYAKDSRIPEHPIETRIAVVDEVNTCHNGSPSSSADSTPSHSPHSRARDVKGSDVLSSMGDGHDQAEVHIPDEPVKTLLSLLFLLFGFLVTTVSLSVTHERMPYYNPLPDIFIDNTNYLEWGLDASEIILMVLCLIAFVVVLLHKHRMIIFRRIFLIIGMLYMYRGVTMFVTVLPKPDPHYMCAPKLNHSITFIEVLQRSLRIISGAGLSINGNQVYCGDFIFSGHTMTLFAAFFVIREYSSRRLYVLHAVVLGLVFLGVTFLVMGRGHYSIDVLIAYWITSRLWWIYHTMAHTHHLKRTGDHNFVSNMWWWHIFSYFEREVPGRLPRVYSLPLPVSVSQWVKRRPATPPIAARHGYQQIDQDV